MPFTIPQERVSRGTVFSAYVLFPLSYSLQQIVHSYSLQNLLIPHFISPPIVSHIPPYPNFKPPIFFHLLFLVYVISRYCITYPNIYLTSFTTKPTFIHSTSCKTNISDRFCVHLRNSQVQSNVSNKLYNIVIWPIVLYGLEWWTLTGGDTSSFRKKSHATDLRYYYPKKCVIIIQNDSIWKISRNTQIYELTKQPVE